MAPRMWQCLIVLSVWFVLPPTISRAADHPSDEFLQMIVQLIGNSDREFRAAGLEQVRTSVKGVPATKLFVAQLPKLDSAGQAALLSALADRGDAAARPAVVELVTVGRDEQVRAAALAALGSLGGTADLPLLIKALSSASAVERAAAQQSLVQTKGDTVNKKLVAESKSAAPAVKTALLEVLTIRRASDELPAFLAAVTDDNAQVRAAALSALGQLGHPEQIAGMLAGVLKSAKGNERDNAEKDVAAICSRIGNEDKRGSVLIDALNTVPVADRDELLSLVGRVGGKKLISFVADIAAGDDAARRKLAIDALSKWPDASVADQLLELISRATDAAERHLAFQAYVKIAAARDGRSDKQRLDRMKEAMKVAQTTEEQSLVINRTRTAYDVESLRFLLPFVDQPQFAQGACETIVEIAHHREVRDPNKAEFDKALDKVIETSKDPVVIDRAKRYQRGETWERPKK